MDAIKLSRRAAAVVGLLAVTAALASGHLVAGLVGPPASPFVAVGNSAIDLTPHPVKDFAIRTFGTYDKLALLVGMAVVIALVAAAAGVASRRHWPPGGMVIVGLGVIGIVAVLDRPDVGLLAVLAPAVATAVGVAVFRQLHRLAMAEAADGGGGGGGRTQARNMRTETRNMRTETDDTRYWGDGAVGAGSRRGFLRGVGATAVGAVVAGGGGLLLGSRVDVQASRRAVGALTPATPASAIPVGADFLSDGTPAFVTSNQEFYRVDTALVVPRITAQEWSLRVHGMVDRELRMSFDELRSRPLVERTMTLTCVSNEVGGPYVSTARFLGVPLRDVLIEAGVQAGADQLVSRSADGWTAGTPTEVVLEPDRGALLAIGMNGEPLPVEHGFPVRMVVPGLYGFVSATKWLVELELTTFAAFDPYWAQRGWAKRAPIKTMSRIDRPRVSDVVAPGRVVVAGVAWAQHRGIDAVEVRVDGGPWQRATLATEVNIDCWRMWRTEFTLDPGPHTVQARATDGTGQVQTEAKADPAPDGATGLHSVQFTVG